MILKNYLLVVSDIERSKAFYSKVLGLSVETDFGANVVLTGGLSLQTLESWRSFISADVSFGGRAAEVYFSEDDFDGFVNRLEKISDIEYVHPPLEHRWGQRVVRFYDPDHHIIEVGEELTCVIKRFAKEGMTPDKIAKRMDIPLSLVEESL